MKNVERKQNMVDSEKTNILVWKTSDSSSGLGVQYFILVASMGIFFFFSNPNLSNININIMSTTLARA
jgi:hypothetical protein